MKALLLLDEKYGNARLPIDVTTFNWYGNTSGYDYPDSKTKDDCYIGFVLIDHKNTETVCNELKSALKLNVDKDMYVGLRIPKDYETDKRVRLSLRLSAGYRGMANPSEFHIRALYQFTISVNDKVVFMSDEGFNTVELAKENANQVVKSLNLSTFVITII